MSDEIDRIDATTAGFEAVSALARTLQIFDRRLTALEAELAVMRGTQSASRWSGDSPPMTIDQPTE